MSHVKAAEREVAYERQLAEYKEAFEKAKEDHIHACSVVATMHAAAVGDTDGPRRGVIEDVADLREAFLQQRKHLDAIREASELALYLLNAQFGHLAREAHDRLKSALEEYSSDPAIGQIPDTDIATTALSIVHLTCVPNFVVTTDSNSEPICAGYRVEDCSDEEVPGRR